MVTLILAATVSIVTVAPNAPGPDCRMPKSAPTAGSPPPQLNRLRDLPDANAIRAVVRKIDGCQYQDVIRFQVGKDGQPYPPLTLTPAPQGGMTPAEPAGR